MSLHPSELGWQEVWFRIGAIFFVLAFLFLVLLLTGRIILLAVDSARWIIKKIKGDGEEEEMSPASLHRAVLKLVPASRRGAAERLLKQLLAPRAEGSEVFVAEYDGRPATVHTSMESAFASCARALSEEPAPYVPWDWFEDEYGWVMRRIDLDTDKPTSLLGGKVTRTEVDS